ncbi:MAG: hypothetical protein ACRDQA_22900 [Nocardioidaceae bacterium]
MTEDDDNVEPEVFEDDDGAEPEVSTRRYRLRGPFHATSFAFRQSDGVTLVLGRAGADVPVHDLEALARAAEQSGVVLVESE